MDSYPTCTYTSSAFWAGDYVWLYVRWSALHPSKCIILFHVSSVVIVFLSSLDIASADLWAYRVQQRRQRSPCASHDLNSWWNMNMMKCCGSMESIVSFYMYPGSLIQGLTLCDSVSWFFLLVFLVAWSILDWAMDCWHNCKASFQVLSFSPTCTLLACTLAHTLPKCLAAELCQTVLFVAFSSLPAKRTACWGISVIAYHNQLAFTDCALIERNDLKTDDC